MTDRSMTPRPACLGADELSARARGVLARFSVMRATELACMVRDEGRDTIATFLNRLDRQDLYGLVVALAAMVPDDQPVDSLLAWVDEAWEEVA